MHPRPDIVFTDLDGTLLDHDSYSAAAAGPALELLARRAIPWVMNTSKTCAELQQLVAELDNPYPFIVENGAAVLGPLPGERDDRPLHGLACKRFVPGRQAIVAQLHRLRAARGWQFTGFADLDAAELAKLTGLSPDKARLALARDFSEPILWQDSAEALTTFIAALAEQGLKVLKGGRFLHVMGDTDKGRAMTWLAAQLFPAVSPRIIALGDSDNDVAMLAAAEVGVVIRSRHHPPPEIPRPRGELRYSEGIGPEGWNSELLALLAQ